MPKISVIIPTYNRSALLEEAVWSVFNQSNNDLELIVADDGSTDDTQAVLRKLQKENQSKMGTIPFTILYQDHRGMPGQVRNFAVASASGKYLAFLDCDDLWIPEKLDLQLAVIEKDGAPSLIHGREIWMRNEKEVSQKGQKHKRQGDIFEDALIKCIIGPSTVLMEKALFDECGGFREDMEIAEDFELWLRITAKYEVGYLDEPLTIKRAGEWDQLSEKYGYIEIFRIQALRALIDQKVFPIGKASLAIEALSRKCLIYAQGCRKRGRPEEADEYEDLAFHYQS